MIFRARARTGQTVEVEDQVDESGEVKSRRRTLRPLAKGALIMVIGADSVVVAVDEVSEEVEEAMVEMANHADVEVIEEAMRRLPRNNYDMATNFIVSRKRDHCNWTTKGFLALY